MIFAQGLGNHLPATRARLKSQDRKTSKGEVIWILPWRWWIFASYFDPLARSVLKDKEEKRGDKSLDTYCGLRTLIRDPL
jgi:hypothetical protein